jgi:hypothetical protein
MLPNYVKKEFSEVGEFVKEVDALTSIALETQDLNDVKKLYSAVNQLRDKVDELYCDLSIFEFERRVQL